MSQDLYVSGIRGWIRKAASWHAPVAQIPSLAVQAIVDALPAIRVNTPWPCADFPFTAPQYFVAIRPDGRRFLVDTEGATYARYIVQLPTDAAGLPSIPCLEHPDSRAVCRIDGQPCCRTCKEHLLAGDPDLQVTDL